MSNSNGRTGSRSPAEDKISVANIDWAALLTKKDFENLAGFFDVLIEMDFEAKQHNKERSRNESVTKSSPDNQQGTD